GWDSLSGAVQAARWTKRVSMPIAEARRGSSEARSLSTRKAESATAPGSVTTCRRGASFGFMGAIIAIRGQPLSLRSRPTQQDPQAAKRLVLEHAGHEEERAVEARARGAP